MDQLVAGVDDIRFDVEQALELQLGALPLPFPGMDKSGACICEFFVKGNCMKGSACPFRHVKGDRTVVCKHWLRGLCKKGDQCEFLHEYDMTKMPECFFYSRFNACSNKECPFLHIDPEAKVRDCPWYDRGFCRHGPLCRHRHTRRVICVNYLCGFCPEGSACKFMHPKFDLPVQDLTQGTKKLNIICHYCGEAGHKAVTCPMMPAELKNDQQNRYQNSANISVVNRPIPMAGPIVNHHNNANVNDSRQYRPLDQVTCYKCGEKGHYANKCPKGHLAFLSSALTPNLNPNAQTAQ